MPEKPGGQLQLNPFLRSVHVPLFKQGLLSHSFISEGNMTKNYFQIDVCTLFTKRVVSQVLFRVSLYQDQYKYKIYGSQGPPPIKGRQRVVKLKVKSLTLSDEVGSV